MICRWRCGRPATWWARSHDPGPVCDRHAALIAAVVALDPLEAHYHPLNLLEKTA